MIYWYVAGIWLQLRGASSAISRSIFLIGSLGALFLIVYAVALGTTGDAFRLQRRIGIIVYFTFTYLAQLLMTWRLARAPNRPETFSILLGICLFLLSVGIFTIILDLTIENYEDYEDAFEWVLALAIHLYFLTTYWTWKESGFHFVGAIKKGSEEP